MRLARLRPSESRKALPFQNVSSAFKPFAPLLPFSHMHALVSAELLVNLFHTLLPCFSVSVQCSNLVIFCVYSQHVNSGSLSQSNEKHCAPSRRQKQSQEAMSTIPSLMIVFVCEAGIMLCCALGTSNTAQSGLCLCANTPVPSHCSFLLFFA